MHSFLTRSSLWAISLLILTTLVGCRKPPVAVAPPPPVVTVAPVEVKEVVEWREFTGRTEAVSRVEIRARVSGSIEAVKFQAGEVVKKGDVLFTIDARPYQAELARREAELAQAQSRLSNATKEAARTPKLLADRAISQEESEGRSARLDEAKAALKAAEASRDLARLDMDWTQVRSPIEGRVSRALLTQGNYANGSPAGASVLTTVVSVDPIHVYVDVDENSLLEIDELIRGKKLELNPEGKIPVELQLSDESNFPHRGFVESFDNSIDPRTGSILLRATVPNPTGRIVPGLFARIRIPGSPRLPSVLIDEAAIGTDQAQKFVMTLTSSNTVAYRPIQLGPLIEGKRVIRSGLQAGEKIVVNGLQRIRPGMAVEPMMKP